MRYLVSIIFPLTDIRHIIGPEKTCLLPCPTWPQPEIRTNFIRNFGKVRIRKQGYEDGFWLGGDMYCEANGILKLPEHFDVGKGIGKVYVQRRFYSTGLTVCWLEILFSIKQNEPDVKKANANFEELLNRILRMKIRIPQKMKRETECPILEAGPALARRFLESSTKSGAIEPEKWWVSDGQPVMMIIAPKSEPPDNGFPKDSYRDVSFKSIGLDDIFHYTLHFPFEASVSVWRLYPSSLIYESVIRSIRLNILRMHVEKECLFKILRYIKGNRFSLEREQEETQRLQFFLTHSLKKLRLGQKDFLGNHLILGRIFHLNEMANKAKINALLQQLEVIQGTLLHSLSDFLNKVSEASKN